MFAQTSIVIALLATSAFASSLKGVDPNTQSCDPKGLEVLMLPHHEECNKFYMCSHGVEILFTCPEGTIFDWVLQICNHETTTNCVLRDPPAKGEDDDDFGEEASGWGEDEEHITGHPNTVGDKPINCKEPAFKTRTAVYRGDCSRYWYCTENGDTVSGFCSDGLYYNPRKEQCDYEVNVKCPYDNHHSELQNEFIAM